MFNEISELEKREKEYRHYIIEHISNLLLAYQKYGNKLCIKLNVPFGDLRVLINEHDNSKWSKEEFDGYRQYYYPCSDETPNKDIMNKAWEHHYKNNPHHPEYWVDENTGDIKDMDPLYITEMLLDWEAMSMKFNNNTYDYYIKERDNKPFSENTRKILNDIILIFKK